MAAARRLLCWHGHCSEGWLRGLKGASRVAFRSEAVELERAWAWRSWPKGHTLALPGRLCPVTSPGMEACLSADDVLGFCEGQLHAERASRVQRHLEVCALCLELVAGAANRWLSPEPADLLQVANNFRPGDRVAGRFEIVRFLARGGMGEVYEALDMRAGDRVALKAVLATLCDRRSALRCFRREARMGRQVQHPNVCRVHAAVAYDPSSAASPVPFFTMDLIQGETLSARLAARAFSMAEALSLAHELLVGLRAIHQAGVLHLDFKSSNVMLRDDAGSPRPVILDFGLARAVLHGPSKRRRRALAGSLAYMPPEQLLGRLPDCRNDVFAFGVVLFEMLTLRLPFSTAQSSLQSSIVQRLAAHAPRPSALVSRVPRWLDEVVGRCLAEPEQRYPDIDAVMAALCAG
jgi:Protein kinase domain